MTLADLEVVEAADRAAWRAWLAKHHAAATGVLVVLSRRRGGAPSLTYDEAVEEALCFGWIDGRRQPHDDGRVRQHFAPRKSGETWAASNKARVERLEREGRMAAAGRRVIEAARRDGSWNVLDEIDALVIPPDLADALWASPAAAGGFATFIPSARRAFLWWIKSARRAETRAQRVADTAWCAARGIRVPQPRA